MNYIHFLRSDRGGQTFCLIERLSKLAGVNPRRIGLSATIGNLKEASAFLGAGSNRKTVAPQSAKSTSNLASIDGNIFIRQIPKLAVKILIQARLNLKLIGPPELADPGIGYIFEHTRGRKCLVFTNSREECEAVCQELRAYCAYNHEPDRFMIHHGNLSPALRETAEAAMKDEDVYMTTCATATLELGIDIGQLEAAFQIDAPFTVSGFLQRMGRTGRRGNPPEMHFVMREEHPESRAMLPELIPWPLLQGIALVQLYAEEKWVEPPAPNRLPYSLLYHQTMSALASGGEMTPAELASRVLTLSYFHNVSQEDYRILLKHLLKNWSH